ncbi:MAG: hypothetical protein M3384_21685 [Acidobacteriota bacterium]|nr:hypothetical protein [Acidobacteriota bacterium]
MSKKYFAIFFVLFLTLTFCPNTFAKYPPIQNERLVMNAMRAIYNAQVQYQATVGAGEFGSFISLRQANLIDEQMARGEKYGYYFTLTTTARTASNPARFTLVAVPRAYRKTGKKSFYIDNRCTLRGADKNGGQATVNDPAIDACVPAIVIQNEAFVIEALRALHNAQMTYQATVGNGIFGTLNQLYQAGLINAHVASGHYRGYVFDCTVNLGQPAPLPPSFYRSRAIPASYGETGVRSFYIDMSGVPRGADKNGHAADQNDPPIVIPADR